MIKMAALITVESYSGAGRLAPRREVPPLVGHTRPSCCHDSVAMGTVWSAQAVHLEREVKSIHPTPRHRRPTTCPTWPDSPAACNCTHLSYIIKTSSGIRLPLLAVISCLLTKPRLFNDEFLNGRLHSHHMQMSFLGFLVVQTVQRSEHSLSGDIRKCFCEIHGICELWPPLATIEVETSRKFRLKRKNHIG